MAFVQCILYILLLVAANCSTEETSTDSPSTPRTSEGCPSNPIDCTELCGCNSNNVVELKPGIVVVEYSMNEASAGSSDNEMAVEDGIATKLQERVDRVFRGIVLSAIFFIVCAGVCVISVCIFCCHIRRSDRQLKNEVKALAKKLKIDINKKDSAPLLRKKRDQKEESCNVVVEDANIMCV